MRPREKSKATRIKKDLEADVVKDFPNLQAAAARSITLGNEISLELARFFFFRDVKGFNHGIRQKVTGGGLVPGKPHFVP